MSANDSLEDRINDIAVSVTKGAVGAIPFVGGLMAEIIGQVVPNQRLDRIADFARALAARLQHIEQNVLAQALNTPEGLDTLEDGFVAASRTLTAERRARLAGAVAKTLTSADVDHVYKKRLLQLSSGLSDAELIMLQAVEMYGRNAIDVEFAARHELILRGPAYRVDTRKEDQAEYIRHESLVQNLLSHKLVSPFANANMVVGMSVPPLFADGTWQANYEITPLGRDVLAVITDAPL